MDGKLLSVITVKHVVAYPRLALADIDDAVPRIGEDWAIELMESHIWLVRN